MMVRPFFLLLLTTFIELALAAGGDSDSFHTAPVSNDPSPDRSAAVINRARYLRTAEDAGRPEVPFTFRAGGSAGVDPRAPGNLNAGPAAGSSGRKEAELVRSSSGSLGGTSRRPARFNEGSVRWVDAAPRPGEQASRPSLVDDPPMSKDARAAHSPTRLALDDVASRLHHIAVRPAVAPEPARQTAMLDESPVSSVRSRASLQVGSQVTTPTTSERAAQRFGQLNEPAFQDSKDVSPRLGSLRWLKGIKTRLTDSDGRSGPTSLESSPRAAKVAVVPYKVWDPKAALRSINIKRLDTMQHHYPQQLAHWNRMRKELDRLDYFHQWDDALRYASENRIDSTRAARIITVNGGVTGSNLDTAPAEFLHDPKNPAPLLDSAVFTPQHRSIKAFRELAAMLPPALTSHSTAVFDAHATGDYRGIQKGFQKAVHPIQYIGQMMRDKHAAVILENSLHDRIHAALASTPPEALAKLTPKKSRKQKSIQSLLGTDYATHDAFWYPQYHARPAFKIPNPLDTPLDHFDIFRPFSEAVALRKP